MKFLISSNEDVKIELLESLEKEEINGVETNLSVKDIGAAGLSFGVPELTIIASSIYVAIEVFKRIYHLIKDKDKSEVKIIFNDGKQVIIKKDMTMEDIERLIK